MQRLQDIADAFLSEAPNHHFLVKLVDSFRPLALRIQPRDEHLFSLYVARHHPLQSIRHEHTFIGIGGAYRTKPEVEGFLEARLHAQTMAKRQITTDDLLYLNHLLTGKQSAALSDTLSPEQAEVKMLRTGELMYRGARPEDFEQGLAYIVQLINQPPALHPLLHGALIHYLLVLLHPFSDGNGRTARMLTSCLLYKHGYGMGHEAYEQYYVWNAVAYQQALNFRQDFYAGDGHFSQITPWLAYYTQSMWEAHKAWFQACMYCWIAQLRARMPLFGKTVHSLVCPAPANVELSIPTHYIRRYGAIGGQWPYTDEHGNIIAWRVRFNGTPQNRFHKSFLFFQYFSDGSWQYSPIQYSGLLPIYRLEEIKPGRTYLLCEGEKAADAAQQLAAPHGITALSWASGAFQIEQTDWSPLGNIRANVYIWRDNDDAGLRAQDILCGILERYGCRLQALPEAMLKDKPKGWDAADALAEGMTPEQFTQWLERSSAIGGSSQAA